MSYICFCCFASSLCKSFSGVSYIWQSCDGIMQEMLDKGKTAAPAYNFYLSAFCHGNEMDKKSLLMDEKNSVASTTASLSRHCLPFFRVVKAGPHDHSFQSRNLRSKRCIPETLISFLCDCTACPTTPHTSNLFLHTFQQNSAVNNNTLR